MSLIPSGQHLFHAAASLHRPFGESAGFVQDVQSYCQRHLTDRSSRIGLDTPFKID